MLEIHIIVFGQSGPRPRKGMKAMASERDAKVCQNFPKAIPKGSVDNRIERWGLVNKKGGRRGKGSGLNKFLKSPDRA